MAPWKRVLATLARRIDLPGLRPFLVGGAVRDILLDREPRDLDFVAECAAGDEEACLKALADVSRMTPVVFVRRPPSTHRVVIDDIVVDTSFSPPGKLASALERRDFTINAIALPLAAFRDDGPVASHRKTAEREAIDPFLGIADLRAKIIRTVGPTSIDDDPLRMLRAVRLAATLDGFVIDPDLAAQIEARSAKVIEAAAERIQAEFDLIFRTPRSGVAIRRMDSLGLLAPLLPELSPLRGLKQPARHHDHDAFEHTLHALDEADRLAAGCDPIGISPLCVEDGVILKWSALLHDAGKAAAATVDADGTPHFYGHESISATLAEEALRRLRVPSRIAEPVVRLVDLHLRLGALASADAGERPIRRLVRAAGELLPLLALLSLADRRASGGPEALAREAALIDVCRRALSLRAEVDAVSKAPALLDGREIMEILGLAPGPRVGSIARWLDRLRVEGRITTREEAVAKLRALPASKTRD